MRRTHTQRPRKSLRPRETCGRTPGDRGEPCSVVETGAAHPIIPAQAKFVRVVGVWLFKKPFFFAFSLLEKSILSICGFHSRQLRGWPAVGTEQMWVDAGGRVCHGGASCNWGAPVSSFSPARCLLHRCFYSFLQGIEQTQAGADISDGGAGCFVEPSWTGSPPLATQNHLFDLQPRDPHPNAPRRPGVQLLGCRRA